MLVLEFKAYGKPSQYHNVKGLVKNRKLAKSISDVGWGIFSSWLKYLGCKYSRRVIAVSPHHTSQDCSKCGATVKKSLATRTHCCPHCGYVVNRDVNAAINILNRGIDTAGLAGIYAWGEKTSFRMGENLSGKVSS